MIQRENPIGEETEDRCADHVSHKKGVAEQTGLGHGVYVVSCEKSCANIRFERGKNLPVDVIEKIDGQEQKECASRAAQRLCPCSLHQQLPIAVCRPPIVNHKPCGPNPLPNARSISLAGHWCAAFIGSLRWVWKTCRPAAFFSCRIISVGWTPSSCSSPAPADPLRHRPGILSQADFASDPARDWLHPDQQAPVACCSSRRCGKNRRRRNRVCVPGGRVGTKGNAVAFAARL